MPGGDFKDFCGDYGYDVDSITALQTFRRCSAFAKRLRAFFTPEEIEGVDEAKYLVYPRPQSLEEMQQIGALLKAVPDLVAACEAMKMEDCYCLSRSEGGNGRPCATRLAKEALKKARGWKVKIIRRTFEAAQWPTGSKERAQLNCDGATSEYMRSYRYIAREELRMSDGSPHPQKYLDWPFHTKAEAVQKAKGKQG